MIRRVARDARAQTRSGDAVRAGRVRVHRLSRRERGVVNGRRARTSRDERVEGLSLDKKCRVSTLFSTSSRERAGRLFFARARVIRAASAHQKACKCVVRSCVCVLWRECALHRSVALNFTQDNLRRRRDFTELVEDPVLEADVQGDRNDGDEDANRHLKLVEIKTVVRDDHR